MLTLFSFTDLPNELQLRISTFLSRHDLRNLSLTSQHLFSITSRNLLLLDLHHHRTSQTLLCCRKYPSPPPSPSPSPSPSSSNSSPSNPTAPTTPPYIFPKRSRALQIEQDPGPFLIRSIEIGTSTSASRPGPIKLHIYKPVFFRPDANERPLDVRVDLTAVSLVRERKLGVSAGTIGPIGGMVVTVGGGTNSGVGGPGIGIGYSASGADVATGGGQANVDADVNGWRRRDAMIEYGAGVCAAGKLALLTARMLRATYTCPECGGTRFVKRPTEQQDRFHMRCVAFLHTRFSSLVVQRKTSQLETWLRLT